MRVADVQFLFDYNYWANERILDTAAQLNTEQLHSPMRLSHGSLHETLVHTLSTEWIWRQRIAEGVSPRAHLEPLEYPTLDDVRARWREEERRLREFLAQLGDDDVDRTIEYRRMTGEQVFDIVWQLLAHVVNHGTQTRSEAAVALTELGHSPGDIDIVFFLRGRKDD
ncbi:MAG: DinB family protein [Chloroflexota bacterium]